jgi:hypothetical protein
MVVSMHAGNTSNVEKHVRSIHKGVLENFVAGRATVTEPSAVTSSSPAVFIDADLRPTATPAAATSALIATSTKGAGISKRSKASSNRESSPASIDDAFMRFVVAEDLPLSVGENPHFRKLVKALSPKRDLAWNAASVYTLIKAAYSRVNEAIRQKLMGAPVASIAITSEGTMRVDHVSYQIVTG